MMKVISLTLPMPYNGTCICNCFILNNTTILVPKGTDSTGWNSMFWPGRKIQFEQTNLSKCVMMQFDPYHISHYMGNSATIKDVL